MNNLTFAPVIPPSEVHVPPECARSSLFIPPPAREQPPPENIEHVIFRNFVTTSSQNILVDLRHCHGRGRPGVPGGHWMPANRRRRR